MKTKTYFLLFILFSNTLSFGQIIKEMYPSFGRLIDKSQKGEAEFLKELKKCNEIGKKIRNQSDYNNLSPADKKIIDNCQDDFEEYWNVLGVGCSWYCGGGQDTATASSELKSTNKITYSANKSHDFSFKTAWIEGVPGYGVGEYIEYHFPPENPRITKIIIVNGYVKSEKAWKDNSRVKKLKLYINNKPIAILNLSDTRQEQKFSFEPIGNAERTDFKKLSSLPWWTMRFEILEVFKGVKFDDTAITEIYFDGIDVH